MANIPSEREILDEGLVMIEQQAKHPHLDAISAHIDHLNDGLREVSLKIHDHPELAYKEFFAHDVITDYVSEHAGWTVNRSAYDIKTAFVAVYDSGKEGPVVSFNAEYDALKGIGHACGHNLIAIASIGGALATAHIIHEEALGGKVVLYGTPAEEGGGGKIRLLNAGAYSDHKVDISLIAHPGISPDSALVRTAAYSSFKVEYYGREAHAAARPWDGINALDALIIAYTSTSALRQQTEPGDIIQGQILNGGLRPNIIHAYASGLFVVRSSSRARLDALKKRVIACFEGAATATGATLEITPKGQYLDHVPNRALGRSYRNAFIQLGGSIPAGDLDVLTSATMASTDQGDISRAMPSIQPNISIRSASGGPHTPDFEKAARTKEAHELALRASKGLAATAVDILTQPELLKEVKREFASLSNEAER